MKVTKGVFILNCIGGFLFITGAMAGDNEFLIIPIGIMTIGLIILVKTGGLKQAAHYEDIQDALSTRIACTDIATLSMKSFEGMTLEDVIDEYPDFLDAVKEKPGMRASLSKESYEAICLLSEFI